MLIMLQAFLETAGGIGLMAGPAIGGVIYGVSLYSCGSLTFTAILQQLHKHIIHTENTMSSKRVSKVTTLLLKACQRITKIICQLTTFGSSQYCFCFTSNLMIAR